jgi:hypothetical protein
MRQGPTAGLVERDSEALGSIKPGYFWTVQKIQLLKNTTFKKNYTATFNIKNPKFCPYSLFLCCL